MSIRHCAQLRRLTAAETITRSSGPTRVLRRLLIDYPVLADLELKRWEKGFEGVDGSGQTYVKRLVDAAYVPGPASGVHQYPRCPECRNTLPGQVSPCGTTGCPGGPAIGESARELTEMHGVGRTTSGRVHGTLISLGLIEHRPGSGRSCSGAGMRVR